MQNQSVQGALGGIQEKIGHLQGQVEAFDTQVKGVGADVNNVESRLGRKINEVKTDLEGDIQNIKSDLKGDIQGVKTDLEGDIQNIKNDLKGDIQGVKTDSKDRQKFLMWFIGIVVVAGGILVNFLTPFLVDLFTKSNP